MISLQVRQRKEEEPTFYELLGVAEDADGMQIEDAFVEKLTSADLTINPSIQSEENDDKLERSVSGRQLSQIKKTESGNTFLIKYI